MEQDTKEKLPSVKYHIDRERCRACGVCIMSCPDQAIQMADGRAQIDEEKCKSCGKCLKKCRFGAIERDPIVLEEIDSTNRWLKDTDQAGIADGTVVIARSQSSGRGRFERKFSSPKGGLYYSQLAKNFPGGEWLLKITPMVVVAVRRAILESTGIEADIKWINDLYVGGKKICGILCESLSIGQETDIIVGIGINVNTRREDFAPEVQDIASSLAMIKGEPVDMELLQKNLTRQLDKLLARPKKLENEYFSEYRKYCFNCPEEIITVQEE